MVLKERSVGIIPTASERLLGDTPAALKNLRVFLWINKAFQIKSALVFQKRCKQLESSPNITVISQMY